MSANPILASADPAARLRWPRSQYAMTGRDLSFASSELRLPNSDNGTCTALGR